jgi:copper chaperone
MTMSQTTDELTYSVPGMSCGHCCAAITAEVEKVAGVGRVVVDLHAKHVIARSTEIAEMRRSRKAWYRKASGSMAEDDHASR